MFSDKTYNYLCKCVFAGDVKCGKSSIRKCLIGRSLDSRYEEMIGIDFSLKIYKLPNEKSVKLIFFDMFRTERNFASIKAILRGSKVILLSVDTSSGEQSEAIRQWLEKINKNVEDKVSVCVIGAKGDLLEQDDELSKKNKELAEICSQKEPGETLRNINEVSYLGICSAKKNEYIAPDWKEGQEKKTLSEDLLKEIAIALFAKSEVITALPQTSEGNSEDPNQALLSKSTQICPQFFKR